MVRRLGGTALAILLAVSLGGCGKPDPIGFRPVLGPVEVDFEPAWDPADSVIAFTHVAQTIEELRRGAYQVWLFDLRADTAAFVATGRWPAWSPDGTALAYVNGGNIFTETLAGHSLTQVTSIGACEWPSWCPTRPLIAFDTNYRDPTGSRVIWIVRTDGTSLTDISIHGTGEWLQPRWLPNGDSLVHLRYVSGVSGSEIYSMAWDGSNPRRLTNNSMQDTDPACSPTGGAVLWTEVSAAGEPSVWEMTPLGTQQRRIITNAQMPAWSPDGQSIVYVSPSARSSNQLRLWIARADGSGPRELVYP